MRLPLTALFAAFCLQANISSSAPLSSVEVSSVVAIHAAPVESLGHSGLRLAPPTADDSASLSFTVAVSPTEQTYLTLRFWGDDTTWGPIHAQAVESGLNLGNLWWHTTREAPFPGRFIYRTWPIPIEVTRGKSSLALRLHTAPSDSTQGVFRNADAAAPKLVQRPAAAIYGIHSHTTPLFVPPASDRHGEPFIWGPPVAKPADYAESIEARLLERAHADITFTLRANVARSQYDTGHRRDLVLLAAFGLIYHTEWSKHYRDASIPPRVRDAVDIHVKRQAAQGGDPGTMFYRGWDAHGQVALAYHRLHGVFLAEGWLDEPLTLEYPDRSVTLSRRQAYANFFHDAFEWRRQDRRHYTNQPVYIARALYRMQKALRDLQDARALTEPQALRYVHEAVGITPLRSREFGIDGADANFPFRTITEAGLTRELGYVDAYGELTRALVRLVEETGDPLVKTQTQNAVLARSIFRLPANDSAGHRVLRGIGFMSWRGPNYPFRITYHGIEEAAILGDPVSLRLGQLEIAHGRPYLLPADPARDVHWNPADSIRLVEQYRKIKDLPPSLHRLPMEPDAPDFVWADEEVGAFAFRQGDTRVYGSFYNNDAAGGRAIGDLGVLRVIRPDFDRLVDFVPESSTPPSGHSLTLAQPFGKRTYAQAPLPPGYTAWQELPPNAIDRRAGLAYFYHLHYGDYLIGMNTTQPGTYRESTYTLEIPAGVKTATDLATGRPVDLSNPVRLGPGETRVLVLQR